MSFRGKCLVWVLVGLLLPAVCWAAVRSGPMAGYPEMREVPLWVQLEGAGEVVFEYWPEGQDRASLRQRTEPRAAVAEHDYAITALANRVVPGVTYAYAVLVDGEEQDFVYPLRFHSAPNYRDRRPPPDLKVAVVSGMHRNEEEFDPPFRTPGGGYSILERVAELAPQMVIWPGGTMALREADWGSFTGYRHRAGYERALPELQPLLGSANHVATWGASDYGPAPADMKWPFSGHAREVFELFWPRNAVVLVDGSMVAQVRCSDVDFFFLDDRSNRMLDDTVEARRRIYGEVQLKWLETVLKRSTANFKVVVSGSPLLNPAAESGWKMARTERDGFLNRIGADRVEGLLFVCGDRPFGEVTRMVRANGPDLYEFSIGPVTARPVESTDELNYFRIPGSARFDRQFGLLEFSGGEDSRKVTLAIYDGAGDRRWSLSLGTRELSYEGSR